MMETLWIIVGIILAIILVIMVIKLLRSSLHVVPEGRRLVVYRLGRFNRIVGPGLVLVIPWLEQIMRTLEVRDHPLEVTVTGIFAYGIPNDLTLNLWCSYDLARAAGGDKHQLAHLAHMSDAERRQQVEVKMREALVTQVAILQKQMPLPAEASPFDSVIALAPGTERYNKLLEWVRDELEKTLPSVGVVLNTSQPITLTGRDIPNSIIDAIQRKQGRDIDSEWLIQYAGDLQHDFPDISKAILAQILGAIEGVDTGKVQRLMLEQETQAPSGIELEYEMHEDGSGVPHAIVKPQLNTSPSEEAHPVSQTSRRGPSSPPAGSTHLSQSDLTVLKRVPRPNDQEKQRLSA
jgi:hypothetical protein